MFSYKRIDRWKYKTCEEYKVYVGLMFGGNVNHPYVKISKGYIEIKEGYMWDGATFCPDFMEIIRGSLVHDALYQMIREGLIRQDRRKKADELLASICVEDGMSQILASIVYFAVRLFAGYAVKKREDDDICGYY
jgi:hypothetical protein